jgi:hypothetical protein
MPPGDQTHLTNINWDISCVFTNQKLSDVKPVCQVHFQNGAKFHAFDGAIIASGLADKYYTAELLEHRPANMERFTGKVNWGWKDLANDFETTLKKQFGFTDAALSRFKPVPSVGDAEAPLGSETITRIIVAWRQWPERKPAPGETIYIPVSETKLGFGVEFDTQSVQIKGFVFQDPELVKLFVQAQSGD